jgi:hypothetical protein
MKNEVARRRRAKAKSSEAAQKLTDLRAKLYQKKRHHEKIQMKKQIKARGAKHQVVGTERALKHPAYAIFARSIESYKCLGVVECYQEQEVGARGRNAFSISHSLYEVLWRRSVKAIADLLLLEPKKLRSSAYLCPRSGGLWERRCSRW